jgi:hypothetical protein
MELKRALAPTTREGPIVLATQVNADRGKKLLRKALGWVTQIKKSGYEEPRRIFLTSATADSGNLCGTRKRKHTTYCTHRNRHILRGPDDKSCRERPMPAICRGWYHVGRML